MLLAGKPQGDWKRKPLGGQGRIHTSLPIPKPTLSIPFFDQSFRPSIDTAKFCANKDGGSTGASGAIVGTPAGPAFSVVGLTGPSAGTAVGYPVDIPGAMTLEAWIVCGPRTNAAQTICMFCDNPFGGAASFDRGLIISQFNRFEFYCFSSGGVTLSDGNSANTEGEIVHLVGTNLGSAAATDMWLYTNGVQTASGSLTNGVGYQGYTSGPWLVVGAARSPEDGGTSQCNSRVLAVNYWSGVCLTPAQVLSRYAMGLAQIKRYSRTELPIFASIGAPAGSSNPTLTGVAATGAVGALLATLSKALTSATASAAAAAVTPAPKPAPTGAAASGAVAGLGPAVSAAFAPAAMSAAVGTLATSAGKIVTAIAASATAAAGSLTAALGALPLAAAASAQAAQLGAAASIAVLSATASAQVAALGVASKIAVAAAAAQAVAASLAARIATALVVNPLYIAAAAKTALIAAALKPKLVATAPKPSFIATAPKTNLIATAPQKNWTATLMNSLRDLSPAIAAGVEKDTVTFDFGPRIAAGVTITSIASVTCSVHSGSDPSPQSRLTAPAQLGPSPASGLANQAVLQQVGTMIGGTVYLLQCVVNTSDGNSPSIETRLPCVTPS